MLLKSNLWQTIMVMTSMLNRGFEASLVSMIPKSIGSLNSNFDSFGNSLFNMVSKKVRSEVL